MSNILEKLAGNKTVANLAFKQIRKYITDENITMICIFVDNNNEIAAKQYEVPVVVISRDHYESMQQQIDVLNQYVTQDKQDKEAGDFDKPQSIYNR